MAVEVGVMDTAARARARLVSRKSGRDPSQRTVGGRQRDGRRGTFDLCGYGWRVYDIAYYYTRIPEPVRAPVIEGYESVRPLSSTEHDMLPTIGRLAWIREGLRSKALVKRLQQPYMSYE